MAPDTPVTVTLGPKVLWIWLREGEVWLSHEAESSEEGRLRLRQGPPPPPPPIDDERWERWATAGPVGRVDLHPVLPPRSIVLQPERVFRLSRGAGARVYVRVPLSIQVRVPGLQGALLEEIPTVTMSDTWWGDPMRGELAFWLPTTARRAMRAELFLPHLAVAPVQLWNRSQQDLRVEKLLLKVEHLALYEESPGRIWTDVATVRYQGESEESLIEKGGGPPEEAPEAHQVAEPRVTAPSGLRAWTFDRIRSFSGLGFPP